MKSDYLEDALLYVRAALENFRLGHAKSMIEFDLEQAIERLQAEMAERAALSAVPPGEI